MYYIRPLTTTSDAIGLDVGVKWNLNKNSRNWDGIKGTKARETRRRRPNSVYATISREL